MGSEASPSTALRGPILSRSIRPRAAIRDLCRPSRRRFGDARQRGIAPVGGRMCYPAGHAGGRRGVEGRGSAGAVSAGGAVGDEEAGLEAVLFDMDGVLCDSEVISRRAAVEVMKELYNLDVTVEDFVPFGGQGEKYFLGGVAKKYGADFDADKAKAKFFDIYFKKYAKPGAGIGYPGALELVRACKDAGMKVALASSADLVKVEANLLAADLPIEMFDVVMSADAFERLKPAPDIFLAAAAKLGVKPASCIVIEDALAGVQASVAAGIPCVAVKTTFSEDELLKEGAVCAYPEISAISLDDLRAAYAGNTGSGGPPAATDQIQEFLEGEVPLPGGYTTSRRDALKILNLFALASIGGYIVASNAKAMSYATPKAIMNSLLSFASINNGVGGGEGSRVDSFKRYIKGIEDRGGGELVPEFPSGLTWFNSPPLHLARELRGKLLVLDFWTYCCINCMHVLPDLAAIEQKFAGKPVAVVGVHSAKFDNEKDSDAIRSAVLRYDISHPVVNDGNMVLWRKLGVSSWPTLMVVSPSGRVLLQLQGEGHRKDLDDILSAGLEYYGEKGDLDSSPVPQTLERNKDARLLKSPLRFPGKIATDVDGDRLFISDSNDHRIIITTLDGKFLTQIGGNGPHLEDGSFSECAFNRPQGLSFDASRNVLYVADTENHALREIDLSGQQVRTLAGNGYQGSDYSGGKKGQSQQLSSPWDVQVDAKGENVFVAMAGTHQIWRYNVADGKIGAFSGNGFERNKNSERAIGTSWAQPSGLSMTADGSEVFVADSESSSIRKFNSQTGASQGCVGGDAVFADNLFKFGDKDGTGQSALLQHPLGVCVAASGKVYVADSYNHRIKELDPATNTITTIAGSGALGYADGAGTSAKLAEPGGIAVGPQGTLLVADTNNGAIRVLAPDSRRLSTLELSGVPPPAVSPLEIVVDADAPPPGRVVRANPLDAQSGEVQVFVRFPSGFHYTKGARSSFQSRLVGPGASGVTLAPASGELRDAAGPAATVRFSGGARADRATIQIDARVYFCEEGKECLLDEVRFEVPLMAGGRAGSSQVAKVEEIVSKKAPRVDVAAL
ncbi:unnamed protein product [Ostreobium quekettii]|uniref:Thioredoxin domain-containing protein n=1 Tax=Ostreobium quekettii TaxID=121088 RepID=A0A8S1J1Q7_9CHLO|nr:unnamed protein product [Ostreobium quekettii]